MAESNIGVVNGETIHFTENITSLSICKTNSTNINIFPWYIEPPSYGIMNLFFWWGAQFNMKGFNIIWLEF